MCFVFHQTEEHFSFLKSKRESWKNHMGINCTLPPSRDGPIAAMDTQGWGNMGLKTGGEVLRGTIDSLYPPTLVSWNYVG